MERNFRELLEARWAAGKFVCVGLDSDIEKIPAIMHAGDGVYQMIAKFNAAIVKATMPFACAFKPNIAFYECHGQEGWEALQQTIWHINTCAPDVPVILDAKRADIGSTNQNYVHAAFKLLRADAITVHPYFGEEAMQPFLDQKNKGIFVLCRTSNPGGGEFQDLHVGHTGTFGVNGGYHHGYAHVPLYRYVAHRVATEWNKNGNCALVVGATYPKELVEVRAIVGNMPILIPGVGAQGGDVEAAVKSGMDSRGLGMIINSSRGIIFASKGHDFAEAAGREAEKLNNLISQHRKENACA
jgi:orotidine-5'-phosphate decarboxylase